MPPSTAEPRKLYQSIIAALQADIEQGLFVPGDRLPSERTLVDRFGVSRLTVREALIGMEIMGLVEARRGSGVYLTAMVEEPRPARELDIGAFELTEARRLVEGECAALAAVEKTAVDLDALRGILEKMVLENENDIHDEVADREFHVCIANATRNQAMVLVVKTLWDVRYRSPLCAEMLERSRTAGVKPRIEDHRAIIDAIAAGNPKRARTAMRRHLARVIDNLLTVTELDAIDRVRRETAELRSRTERYEKS